MTIHCILQDHQGFMWFGADNGLIRYDGYTSVHYQHKPNDPATLSDNEVLTMFEDHTGALWIGTANGLNRFNRHARRFIRYHHHPNDFGSISHNEIRAIQETPAGQLWIGTANGLNRLDPDSELFVRYSHDPNDPTSLSHNEIWTMRVDRTGQLWIGTLDGLNRLDSETEGFIRYYHSLNNPYSLSDDHVRSLYEDQAGYLWVGTFTKGVNQFDPATGHFIRHQHDPEDPASLSSNTVLTIHEDRTGTLWFGTWNGGLNRFDRETGQFRHYSYCANDPRGLSSNDVISLHDDHSGMLWIGTWQHGLNCLSLEQGRFVRYQANPPTTYSLSSNVVTAIQEDRAGAVWIGTWGKGLNKFDPRAQQVVQYRHDPNDPGSLSDNDIRAIHEDQQGTLWVGTAVGGLHRFDRRHDRFRHYRHDSHDPHSLGANQVTTIYEDQDGMLWIGTWGGGLNRFDRQRDGFLHYRHEPHNPHSLSSDIIQAVYEDREGMLWVGTKNMGLNRLDRRTGSVTRYRHDSSNSSSLSHPDVRVIYEDRSGTLWIGTGRGLNKFNPQQQTFTRYTERDGLPDDAICGILEDARGHLWLSTEQGLVKFDPRTVTFGIYQTNDCLAGEFMPGAYYHSPQGEMFFGSKQGLTVFLPDRIQKNRHPPKLVITDFRVFDTSVQHFVPDKTTLTLAHNQNVFSFDFAALHYANPSGNQHAYMLEGIDTDWIQAGDRSFTTYSRIPPGDYVFRVKGANSDGVWNEQGLAVRVQIIPPFWKTGWFRFSLVASGIGILLAGYYLRIRAMKRQKARLEEQIQERTHELETEKRKLGESEERFRGLSRATFEGVVLHDNGIITEANQAALTMFGYTYAEIVGRQISQLIVPEEHDAMTRSEARGKRKDGATFPIEFRTKTLPYHGQQFTVTAIRDITERKQAEMQLQTSLQEKELLLKEIHHRVKNNLQIVSSLLRFQANRIHNPETFEIFRECQNRINSMLLIHEQLYRSKHLAYVNFAGYLRNLTASIFRAYGPQARGIRLQLDIQILELDIERAISCGLIINELVSNALKYAFSSEPMTSDPVIHVILRTNSNNQWTLIVSDNGGGISEKINFQRPASLGLQLVSMLTQQLEGAIEVDTHNGTTVTITFPKPEHRSDT